DEQLQVRLVVHDQDLRGHGSPAHSGRPCPAPSSSCPCCDCIAGGGPEQWIVGSGQRKKGLLASLSTVPCPLVTGCPSPARSTRRRRSRPPHTCSPASPGSPCRSCHSGSARPSSARPWSPRGTPRSGSPGPSVRSSNPLCRP